MHCSALHREAGAVGLQINTTKIKVMSTGFKSAEKLSMMLTDAVAGDVDCFVYFHSANISTHEQSTVDLDNSIHLALSNLVGPI